VWQKSEGDGTVQGIRVSVTVHIQREALRVLRKTAVIEPGELEDA
jgi:hypothetical protein